MKVVVLGSAGQLGRQVVSRFKSLDAFDCISLSREDLNISELEKMQELLNKHNPDIIINCAAYTAVDLAEEQNNQAFLVNAENVRTLARYCFEMDIWLLHFSTDYVFDGRSSVPYKESDPTSPISVYGASKLAGEKAIFEENGDACVVRTSWLYGDEGNNFVNTMIRLGMSKSEINVVDDQVSSPTYVGDLVTCTEKLIESGRSNAQMPKGLFHFSNSGEVSWCDFARAIMDSMKLDCEVKPISTKEFGAKAQRPRYSKLDCTLIEEKYGIHSRPWKEGLDECLRKKI